jgi:hypothetical protein
VNRGPLLLALLTFAWGVTLDHCAPVQADTWTEHEVALGRLCVNEASSSLPDCVAIVEARGSRTVEQLRAMHPRALAPSRTDGRRWIAGLSADLSRPDGWPEHLVPWDTRGRAGWERTLDAVRDTLAGRRSQCTSAPSIWGGPVVDSDRIARHLARGAQVVCHGTRNVFLRYP